MERFSSLKLVPAETRSALRDRWPRYLPRPHNAVNQIAQEPDLSDEAALELLLNLHIESGSDLEFARSIYETVKTPDNQEPSFEELIDQGWLTVVWNRISIPFELARAAQSTPDRSYPAFNSVLAVRYQQHFSVTGTNRADKRLSTMIASIEAKEFETKQLHCQSPRWVAAHLWDRSLTGPSDHEKALRVWLDRWRILQSPTIVPAATWSADDANSFRSAALKILSTIANAVSWEQFHTHLLKQLSLVHGQPSDAVSHLIPKVSSTAVDQAVWFDDNRTQHILRWILDPYENIFALIHLLLEDVAEQEHSAVPNKIASTIFELATKSPVILLGALWKIRARPILLVDFALYPATSALACLLIVQWQINPGAWDRELRIRDNQTTKSIAFADSAFVMAHYLRLGNLPVEEVASLLVWLHGRGRRQSSSALEDSSNSELVILRGELMHQPPEVLESIAAHLIARVTVGLGDATFAAALDLIEISNLSDRLDPAPLVNGYVASVAKGDYTLSAEDITPGGAGALLQLAKRASPDLYRTFLHPVDVRTRLAFPAEENPYTVADSIARSLRVHIRILCRAIAASPNPPSSEVMDALIVAIQSASLSHKEKGRVAAFSSRYESNALGQAADRPLAADLGAAISRVRGDQRNELLAAILGTDEPSILAQLIPLAPFDIRNSIRQRITELTPTQAGEILTLTEAQARVEALLTAGLADAAALFIEAEQELKTLFGEVPGRATTRLRSTLRLHFIRREWSAIAEAIPLEGLSQFDQQAARDTILFYQALAELSAPEGNLQRAEQIFAQLHARRPEIAAYAVNLFAARLGMLLGGNYFQLLEGASLVHGRALLSATEQLISQVRILSDADASAFRNGKAVLLLALGEPAQAYEILTIANTNHRNNNEAAYTAVALNRLGRTPEALTILEEAERETGSTDILRSARTYIQSGTALVTARDLSIDDDFLSRIKNALWDFRQLDHIHQAELLHASQDPFGGFVIDQVREASASVTSLIPMMKVVELDSCEDDLTALIRELLRARLYHLGWSVPDQSKGGFTSKGNPGERDLLLQKDSTIIAVLEAVVHAESASTQNLRYHFQKTLAYANCRMFVHLTYSYSRNPALVLERLRDIAVKDAPSGFKYIGHKDLSWSDTRPVGIVARYSTELGEITVAFFMLDMRQQLQRDTAQFAAAVKNGS